MVDRNDTAGVRRQSLDKRSRDLRLLLLLGRKRVPLTRGRSQFADGHAVATAGE
jgi:hypothetical protein